MTDKILTPIKAIRAKCIDCCGGVMYQVRECGCSDCSLYPYRMGKNPNRKRNAEQTEATQDLILSSESATRSGGKSIEAVGEGNYTSPMQRDENTKELDTELDSIQDLDFIPFVALEKDN
jgi:hypothetical protein